MTPPPSQRRVPAHRSTDRYTAVGFAGVAVLTWLQAAAMLLDPAPLDAARLFIVVMLLVVSIAPVGIAWLLWRPRRARVEREEPNP